MNFCPSCGAAVELRCPEDDNRPRHVCTACGLIHYLNPKIVVIALPVWEDRILMCRRAIEPRHGLWTLPGGFMENGESTEQAAARETLEEANARVEIGPLYAMYSLPYINQVQLLFHARLLDLDFSPGSESLEVKLLGADEIPWDALAFRPVQRTLQRFLQERDRGSFTFQSDTLSAPGHTHD